jgi:hypothetical protein
MINDGDWFQLLGNTTRPGWWIPRENGDGSSYTPILELGYADGYSMGMGYMEVWEGNPKPISGIAGVRETFTVKGQDRKVSSVAVRLRRVNGVAPLTIRLEKADGSLVASGAIDSEYIDTNYTWVEHTFEAEQTLLRGEEYNLTLQAPIGTHYETFPIRKGSSASVNFSPSTYFSDGYAQFTTNGSWTGWDQWGVTNRNDADLQFVFTLVHEPV